MNITLLHVTDCPNLVVARDRVVEAAGNVGLVIRVEQRLVRDQSEAAALGFTGSPTILIDGADPFAPVDAGPSMACRLYQTAEGVQGAPSVPDLVRALRQRAGPAPESANGEGGHVFIDRVAEAVRWAAFDRLRTGRAVTAAELAAEAQLDIDQLEEVLARLVGSGLLERDTEGVIVGSHGLTLRSTVHRLVLDGVALHTWCALDAIAIPAALEIDATLTTRCFWCSKSLRVMAPAGRPHGGNEFRVWVPGTDCDNVLHQFCPFANVFCSTAHLEQWRAGAGDPIGRACTVTEIADLGPTWWSRDPDCCSPGDGERSPW